MRVTFMAARKMRAVRTLGALGALGAVSAIGIAACSSSDIDTPQSLPQPQVANGTKATLALLETTDIHTNLLSYGYYRLAEDKSLGLERTATLIAAARKEFPNTLLLDDGDTIQGTALADYQAQVAPIDCKTTLVVYKVMKLLKYDAGTIGNHEFNYGLPFLAQVTGGAFDVPNMSPVASQPACAGPNFPLVLSNVLGAKSQQPIFKPYAIIERHPDGHDARRQNRQRAGENRRDRLHAARDHGVGQALARRQRVHPRAGGKRFEVRAGNEGQGCADRRRDVAWRP